MTDDDSTGQGRRRAAPGGLAQLVIDGPARSGEMGCWLDADYVADWSSWPPTGMPCGRS